MNLRQSDPVERVSGYFKQVNYNGQFYGIMRRVDVLRVRYENEYSNDWMLIGAMTCIGQLITTEATWLNKADSGMSANPQALAAGLGLSKFGSRYPWLMVGIATFADIVWRNEPYRCLSLSRRVRLGIIVADSIWMSRRPMPDWWWRYGWLRAHLLRILR